MAGPMPRFDETKESAADGAADVVDAVSATLPKGTWLNLLANLDRFTPETQRRGRQYARDGHVRAVHVRSDRIDGVVVGTRTYQVSWVKTPTKWMPRCTCPQASNCKHAYATLWQLVLQAQNEQPPPPPRPVEPVVARESPAVRLLEQFRNAREPWALQDAVVRLLQLPGGPSIGPHSLGFQELAQESDPDVRCWQLAQMILARSNGVLPRALASYRDRPDLASRHAGRLRDELANEVVAWAGRMRRGPERSLRVVLGLVPRANGTAAVTVDARLTTARLVDASRTSQQLLQMRTELGRDPLFLDPEQAALLSYLTNNSLGGHHYGSGAAAVPVHVVPPLVGQIARSPLGAWSEKIDPALAERAGVVAGAPIGWSTMPVRLVPDAVQRDDETWLVLRYVWPDGRRRELEQVVHLERTESHGPQSSLVVADGEFFTVVSEPPAQLVERFRVSGGVPLSESSRVPMLQQLAQGFPHLSDTLRTHTRTHAVAAAVVLELHNEEWLQVRVLATPLGWRPGSVERTEGAHFEYLADGGWQRLAEEPSLAMAEGFGGAPVAVEADGAVPPPTPMAPELCWIDEPDAATVAPAVEWLEAARGTASTTRAAIPPPELEQTGGWWVLLNPKRLELLANAWATRPLGVAFYGTSRVRRLLEGAVVVPRVQIEASGLDWFSVSAEWQAEGIALSEDDLETLRTAKTRFVKLSTGWTDRTAAGQHDAEAQLLADLGVEAGGGAERVSVWQLAGARPESLEALAQLGADTETLRAIEALRERVQAFDGLPHVSTPPGFTAELRPYQQDGVDFLSWTSSLGLGAILADDMGLGKTVQALGWLAHLKAIDPEGGPSLVVCPASVVHNWQREAARFVPNWRVLVLARGAERHALRAEIAQYDLVVTNYALLRHDIEAWREIPLRAVILDEAQNIKNPDAAVSRAALSLQAQHRVVLTGTPLENRALDLWSLMNFVRPGYLGTRQQFVARYDRSDTPGYRRTLLASRVRPVLLRRIKRDVAHDLPERIEERRDCELSPGQRRLYLAELRRSQQLVSELADDPGEFNRQRIQVLAALTRLRQICCHPQLAGGTARLGSGKFDALFELLEPLLAEGHKVLVFSQFVECLKLLAGELTTRGLPHHILTGQTVKREAVVEAFTEAAEPCVFLVSLKAGGTGLNLTAASYVILFDPWWNPAVEAQAIDRVHRIGQDKTVVAYRLVASGTIEEKIWDLQARKAAMINDVLGESGFGRALTRDDLTYLFAPDDD